MLNKNTIDLSLLDDAKKVTVQYDDKLLKQIKYLKKKNKKLNKKLKILNKNSSTVIEDNVELINKNIKLRDTLNKIEECVIKLINECNEMLSQSSNYAFKATYVFNILNDIYEDISDGKE